MLLSASLSATSHLVSVVIVSYNSERFIRPCIEALLQSDYPIHEIIVVDNASSDNSANIVEQSFPQVRLIKSPRNLGYAGGCNLGVKHVSGDVIAFVNPDVTIKPSWLSELMKVFAKDSSVGIAGGKLLYPDLRTIQHAGACLRYPLAISDHYGYGQPDDGRWNKKRDVEYVTGAAFVIRRDTLDSLNGFDERFFPTYYEETDLCWRARRAGFKVVYAPRAVGIHYEAATLGKHSYAHYYHFHLNRLRFVLKNYSRDQLLKDFFPSEREYLERISFSVENRAIDKAYKEIIDRLYSEMLQEGHATVLEVSRVGRDTALIEALEQLRKRSGQIIAEKSAMDPLEAVIFEINALRPIVEPNFRSNIPVLGPAIAGFRSAWNWVSTKWYVKHILHEQNEINAKLVQCMNEMASELADLRQRLEDVERRDSENSLLQSSESKDK